MKSENKNLIRSVLLCTIFLFSFSHELVAMGGGRIEEKNKQMIDAIENDKTDEITSLLSNDVKIPTTIEAYETCKQEPIIWWLCSRDYDFYNTISICLTQSNIDLNACSSKGESPIIAAIVGDHASTVELLLKKGVSVPKEIYDESEKKNVRTFDWMATRKKDLSCTAGVLAKNGLKIDMYHFGGWEKDRRDSFIQRFLGELLNKLHNRKFDDAKKILDALSKKAGETIDEELKKISDLTQYSSRVNQVAIKDFADYLQNPSLTPLRIAFRDLAEKLDEFKTKLGALAGS